MKPFSPRLQHISRLMESLCPILQIAGIVAVCTLPWTLKTYLVFRYAAWDTRIYVGMLLLLAVSGVCAFFILGLGRKILHNINLRNPFTLETARCIHAIALWCLPIALIYFWGSFLVPSPFVWLVCVAFLFLSALILIMGSLFYEAVRYKEENDLTI